MRNSKSQVILPLFACLLSLAPFFSTSANAEGYVAFQLGGNFPSSLSDVEGTQNGTTVFNMSDLELKNSFLYGGKVGYYFSGLKWLGVETEAYSSTPDIKQQAVTVSFPGLGFVTGTLAEADLRVTTLAFNLLARVPGEKFQPYAGVGLGIFFAGIDSSSGLDSDNAVPGLNILAGARYLLTKNLGLFGEYKFNHAHFSFDVTGVPGAVLEADYNAHILAFGVSYHF
jgi:opacity protein-like surface antigen